MRRPCSMGSRETRRTSGAGRSGAAGPRDDRGATPMRGANPVVSVVVPVHNGEPFIRHALRSVIVQDYRPLEIVVVDDGSTDGTARVTCGVADACDVPVRYVFEDRRGPAAARNRGIGIAQGDIIAFQDADDLWTEHKLATQMGLLAQHPAANVVLGYTRVVRSTADGGMEDYPGNAGRPGLVTVLQAALFRRAVFDQVGLLDEGLLRGEDIDWFLRALEQNTEMVTHSDVVLLYRRHAASLTSGDGNPPPSLLLALKRSLRRRRKSVGQEGGPVAPLGHEWAEPLVRAIVQSGRVCGDAGAADRMD